MQTDSILSDTYELSEKIKSYRYKVSSYTILFLLIVGLVYQFLLYHGYQKLLFNVQNEEIKIPLWALFICVTVMYSFFLSVFFESVFNFIARQLPCKIFEARFEKNLYAGAGIISREEPREYKMVSIIEAAEYYNLPVDTIRIIKNSLDYNIYPSIFLLNSSCPVEFTSEGRISLNSVRLRVREYIYYLLPAPALFYFYATHPIVFN